MAAGRQPAPGAVWVLTLASALCFLTLFCLKRYGSWSTTGGPLVTLEVRRSAVDRGSSADDPAAVAALLATWPKGKPRACIVILARNSDLEGVLSSVGQFERRFNAEFGYPFCYLNDQPFSPEFKRAAAGASASPSFFGLVPREHWSYPPHINQTLAAERRAAAKGHMPYGGSESYRFMCRYFSGFFFDHPLLERFEWYWRVEPDVHFMCNLRKDPFRHMAASNHSMAWVIMMQEVMGTIPTLWPTVQQWLVQQPQHVAQHPLLPAFLRAEAQGGLAMRGEGGERGDRLLEGGSSSSSIGHGGGGSGSSSSGNNPFHAAQYTGGHMWSNFEIGRLSFFRSEAYRSFFRHLDLSGGFFYERWGDAPVHTLGAASILDRRQIYFAEDIGYHHGSWSYCPSKPEDRPRCDCQPKWDYHPLAQPQAQIDFKARLAALQQEDPL